jgi:Viral (Superfamily 1) RNA helicase
MKSYTAYSMLSRLQEMAQEYARRPEGTLVISPDNESRRELNLLIHRAMQDAGQVQRAEKTIRVLESRQDLTGADRGWAERYQPNDVLRYSHGSKLLGIRAGEYTTVTDVDSKRNLLTVESENGEGVTYDPRRLQGVSVYREAERQIAEGDRVQFTAPSKDLQVANRELGTVVRVSSDNEMTIRTDSRRLVHVDASKHPHLDYGYAMTSHSSQGQTADRVLVHVDTEQGSQLVNSRMAYVAISRGRYDGQIYTDSKADLADHLSRKHSHSTAISSNQNSRHEHRVDTSNDRAACVGNDTRHEQTGMTQSHAQAQSDAQGEGVGAS